MFCFGLTPFPLQISIVCLNDWFVAMSGGGFLELSVATSVVTEDRVYRQVHKGLKGCPHNGQV